jgi:hypothetical protein
VLPSELLITILMVLMALMMALIASHLYFAGGILPVVSQQMRSIVSYVQ